MFCRDFFYWCRTAVSKIKYGPDRNAVHKELMEHMEDRCESFLDQGFSLEEAQAMTLEAMGDPEELSAQLAAIHRPHWAYAMIATRIIAIVLAVFSIVPFIRYAGNLYLDNPDYSIWNQYETPGHERILYLEPDIVQHSDGYIFRLTKAALGRSYYADSEAKQKGYFDSLYFQIKVTNPRLWMPEQEAINWFWAEDDRGTRYYCMAQYYTADEPWVAKLNANRTGLSTYIYDMELVNLAEDLRWVKLHYDRSGRDMVFYIDLTGGAQQ